MAVVLAFLVLTWCVLIFTVYKIIALASTVAIKAVIVISAGSVIVFATAALIAVMLHLRKRKESIYREDIAHRKNPN